MSKELKQKARELIEESNKSIIESNQTTRLAERDMINIMEQNKINTIKLSYLL